MAKLDESPTDGARDFEKYLRKTKSNVTRFCREHGIEDRIAVMRAVKGKPRRISVDFALLIETLTGGEVRIHRWATARPKKRATSRAAA